MNFISIAPQTDNHGKIRAIALETEVFEVALK